MASHTPPSFLDETFLKLRVAWQGIAGGEYDIETASLRPNLPADDAKKLRLQMQECLDSKGGEVSARQKAAALGHVYMALDGEGRERFLLILATEFDVDHQAVYETAQTFCQSTNGDQEKLQLETTLRRLLEAPRIKLLTQFNALPEGVKFLVDMRADLLPLVKKDAALKALDNDLKSMLSHWFDVGFLELRQITWENSSAALLERLIAYEAVHEIKSWDDLKNRLDSDRRCFAFFHPRMPEEPLIFVEVALVNGLAGNVQALLDENAPVQNPNTADTAIFYSISNAQKGLAGISFGNFLIKRVVESLSVVFPTIKTFATLSPIPGFLPWLEQALEAGTKNLLSSSDRKTLNTLFEKNRGAKGGLKKTLSSIDWASDSEASTILKAPLMNLCARYLAHEKKRESVTRDPVAHFHLTNGAQIEVLNWMGDSSDKGLIQSAGLMVNYLYKKNKIDINHEKYKANGTISMSSAVRNMAK